MAKQGNPYQANLKAKQFIDSLLCHLFLFSFRFARFGYFALCAQYDKVKQSRHSERSALARSEESKANGVLFLDSHNVANANL